MREYQKPLLEIEKFLSNVTVASCDRVQSGTETTYDPQQIDCIISTTDVVFANGQTDCTHEVDITNTNDTSYKFVEYDSDNDGTRELWFCWKGKGSSQTRPTENQVAQLQAICAAAGITNAQGWHAGKAVGTIINLYTAS